MSYTPQNFQMRLKGISSNGSATLPPPSGAAIALTAGVGAVASQDVRLALANGWELLGGQNFPAAEAFRMTPPTGDGLNWPASGTFTLPDGVTVLTITSGIAIVPAAWRKYLESLGWTRVA